MTAPTNELARITIDTPDRRLDLAVPATVPLADLVTMMVRAGGERLADRGAASGWVVRRADGTPLSGAQTLSDQGVRDGSALRLAPADEIWPEPEFDDIADAIASVRRLDTSWSALATRSLGTEAGILAALLALAAIVHDYPASTAALIAGGLALALLGAGGLLTRALGDGRTGEVLAGLALPYGFVAGLFAAGGPVTASHLLAAGATLALATSVGMLAVGRMGEVSVAGMLGALAACLGAFGGMVLPAAYASAVLLAAITLGAGGIPGAAVRLSGLARWSEGTGVTAASDDALPPAVRRTDTIITGLCAGSALVAMAAATMLVAGGSMWSRLLVLACAASLAMRTRNYGSIPQRLAALAAGAGPTLPLLGWAIWSGFASGVIVAVLAVTALLAVVLTAGRRDLAVLTSVGRLVEMISVLAVLPLLCGAVGLYARVRSLT